MPIRIRLSYRDDSDSWLYRVKKLQRRGVFPAVVSDLQNVGTQGAFHIFRKYRCLRLLLRVTGQEDASVAVPKPQNERVVVLRSLRASRRERIRPQKLSLNSIPFESLAPKLMFNRDFSVLCQFFQAG